MISISHAPNTNTAQRRLAWRLLLPWHWSQWGSGQAVAELEQEMKARHQSQAAFAFSTGREALQAVLQACGIGAGDEVIIQAYTCIVVPNAIRWLGARPIYVDVDGTLNIDPALIEQKISPKTKAIIVQHTFGTPADLSRIQALCNKHDLLLIEDCAHALGATSGGKLVGTFGQAAIYSFGRDKIISSVSGGMAITSSQAIADALQIIQQGAAHRPRFWIKQNLLHPIIVPLCVRWMGRLKLGEIFLTLAQRMRLLNRVYTPTEKQSMPPTVPYHKMPNSLALLALQQLKEHLENFNQHRRMLATTYIDFCLKQGMKFQQAYDNTEAVFLRFTCFVQDPAQIIQSMKTRGYLLGDWYHSVIMPQPEHYVQAGYLAGSCPKAEEFAKRSLNLPTHLKMTERIQENLLSQLEQSL